jgi:translation elongation factor EF-1alpha
MADMADMAKEVRVSLLGHKDHGKSTLIGRLLHDTGSITRDRINEARGMSKALGRGVGQEGLDFAFLLDSFEEEREGGFTLDTTRAQVKHGGTIYEMIDVPGHRELVRNMLSGASMADGAVLVVSVKEGEGLQDETRLHLYLAGMLGISRLVVAVNKMDCAGYGEAPFIELSSAISRVLAAFGFREDAAAFVPVSAMRGDNIAAASQSMPWYHGKTLLEHMAGFGSRSEGRRTAAEKLPARLFVQDVYGDMVVGRLESGSLRVGDEVAFEPSGVRARIKGLHGGARATELVSAGQNVGMTLGSDHGGVKRGCVCVPAAEAGLARTSVRARIFCFGAGLNSGDALGIACATQEGEAKVTGITGRFDPAKEDGPARGADCSGVKSGEAAIADIALSPAMVFESFARMPATGRFILAKGGRVVAAGVVL